MNPTLTLPRPLAIAALLAFLGILYGFTLGAQFGANEDRIKAAMEESGRAVLATVYAGDEERMMGVVGRSWTYLQRAHLHGGAIGTAALASILALALLCRGGLVVNLSGLAFGFGALVYPFFWGMAAFRAPGLGGTDAVALGRAQCPHRGFADVAVVVVERLDDRRVVALDQVVGEHGESGRTRGVRLAVERS